jgi:hypothetical protein
VVQVRRTSTSLVTATAMLKRPSSSAVTLAISPVRERSATTPAPAGTIRPSRAAGSTTTSTEERQTPGGDGLLGDDRVVEERVVDQRQPLVVRQARREGAATGGQIGVARRGVQSGLEVRQERVVIRPIRLMHVSHPSLPGGRRVATEPGAPGARQAPATPVSLPV